MFISKFIFSVLCIASALGGAFVSGVLVSVNTKCVTAERTTPIDTDKKFEARNNKWGSSEDF